MAADPRPFNSRGQILSAGGEKYGAYLLRRKESAFSVLQALDRKYGPATPETLSEVLDVSKAGLTAGRLLHQSERSGEVDISQIPVNEFLFGGDSGRGRFFIAGSVGPEGQPPKLDVNVVLPASISWAQLNEQFFSSLDVMRTEEKYERLVKWLTPDENLAIGIWFAERQF